MGSGFRDRARPHRTDRASRARGPPNLPGPWGTRRTHYRCAVGARTTGRAFVRRQPGRARPHLQRTVGDRQPHEATGRTDARHPYAIEDVDRRTARGPRLGQSLLPYGSDAVVIDGCGAIVARRPRRGRGRRTRGAGPSARWACSPLRAKCRSRSIGEGCRWANTRHWWGIGWPGRRPFERACGECERNAPVPARSAGIHRRLRTPESGRGVPAPLGCLVCEGY